MFPECVVYKNPGFGTSEMGLIFGLITTPQTKKSSLVPREGVEPSRGLRPHRFLRPTRLPFRHLGSLVYFTISS